MFSFTAGLLRLSNRQTDTFYLHVWQTGSARLCPAARRQPSLKQNKAKSKQRQDVARVNGS